MTQLENRLQKDDSMNFSEDSQMSTNLNSKGSLIRRLRKGRHVRTRFVESQLDKKLAFQIRSLRGDSSQEEMEKRTGIKQQVISRLENPYYGKATLTTLKKIAAASDVGLLVEFVPYSELINRVSGTPYVERGYRPQTMNVASFEEEERQGAFETQAGLSVPVLGTQLGSAPVGMDDIITSYGTAPEPSFLLPSPQRGVSLPLPFQGARGVSSEDQISIGVGAGGMQ
jgi:transcriptional regulator with XRE-family HTH domain